CWAWRKSWTAAMCCRDSDCRFRTCSRKNNRGPHRHRAPFIPHQPSFQPMAQLTLFDDRPSQATRLAPRLRALAAQGISFGTSSWKYQGWLGSIYTPDRYSVRGKFSHRKFEAECLAEYAETFPVVCGEDRKSVA